MSPLDVCLALGLVPDRIADPVVAFASIEAIVTMPADEGFVPDQP